MAITKGSSKVTKVTFKEPFNITLDGKPTTLYGFNVEFENGIKGLYNAKDKDNPKFVVGEIAPYSADEREKDGRKYTIIKYDKPFTPGGGNKWKPKPKYVMALEWARKMYNSSQKTPNPWSFDQLTKMASFFLKKRAEGVSSDAIECAVTIECSLAMDEQPIDTTRMAKSIRKLETWIAENKGNE